MKKLSILAVGLTGALAGPAAAQAQDPLVEVLTVSQAIDRDRERPALAHARLPRHLGRRQRLGHHRPRHPDRLHSAPRRQVLDLPLQLAGRLARGDRRPALRPPQRAGWGERREPRGRLGRRARRENRSRARPSAWPSAARPTRSRPAGASSAPTAPRTRSPSPRPRRRSRGWVFRFENRGSDAAVVTARIRCLASTQRAASGQQHSFSLRAASYFDRIAAGANQTARPTPAAPTSTASPRASRSTPPTTSCRGAPTPPASAAGAGASARRTVRAP